MDIIRYERGPDGVVLLTMDDPARSANTMNDAFTDALAAAVDRLEAERDDVTGVILTSAKKTFFAGGDLDMLSRIGPDQAAEVMRSTTRIKGVLRRLETLGRPVVAAINGSALGGGLELALACHHRIVADDPRVEIGFPEVTLGLLPGAGGVVRTVRLLGIVEALMQVLLKGQRHRPASALQVGLVHSVVPAGELVDRARDWIAANPGAVQPWDVAGYRIPGGTPSTPALAANLPAFPATLRKELKGAPYPAPRNILAAAVEGAQVDLATAFTIEGRYFTELATGQIAKNMIKAFFFDLQAANARGSSTVTFGKVAVLGAGMMGAAIAYVCAKAGLEVVLKDVTLEAARRGKAYAESRRHDQALLDRITPTAEITDLAGADLVIEAVFEDPGLKHKVFAEIEDVVAADALLCSNTSTLPITMLAEGVRRRADFVGLHFFSPVDKMPLVEVIRGAETSDDAVDKALAVVRLLKKTPIVVNDSRGFFTSRVIGTFTTEALRMLAEGIPAPSIEQASLQAGYPAPVLQLLDELTLTLPRKIRHATRDAVLAAGGTWEANPADDVLDRMVDEFGRTGRAGGAGFYEYADGKRGRLWPGLREHFERDHGSPAAAAGSSAGAAAGGPSAVAASAGGSSAGAAPARVSSAEALFSQLSPAGVSFADVQERMLFAEALESVKCLDEGVLTSVADANIGSILGIGFPGWTGGVLQYINQYEGGLEGGLPGFIARARELADRYGDRFTPPPSLLAKAERGETFV